MIIGFIVFGIVLIVVEIIFVPGTTIVGIGGLVCASYGIYLSFVNFGKTSGLITLSITGIFCIAALVYSLKTRSWERFSLKGASDSKFNDEFKESIKVGDIGKSISSLKPIGKALFEDKEFEVRSTGGYLNDNTRVRVIKVEQNKIFVEPIIES